MAKHEQLLADARLGRSVRELSERLELSLDESQKINAIAHALIAHALTLNASTFQVQLSGVKFERQPSSHWTVTVQRSLPVGEVVETRARDAALLLVRLCRTARNALRSYEYGLSTPALAAQVANQLERVITAIEQPDEKAGVKK